jgi:hypothetical protein
VRPMGTARRTLDAFYFSNLCAVCGKLSSGHLCASCAEQPQVAGLVMIHRVRAAEAAAAKLTAICGNCVGYADAGRMGTQACSSLDCIFMFKRVQASQAVVALQEQAIQHGWLPEPPPASSEGDDV